MTIGVSTYAGAPTELRQVFLVIVVTGFALFGAMAVCDRPDRPGDTDPITQVYTDKAAAQAQAAHMRAEGWPGARSETIPGAALGGWIVRIDRYRTLRADGHVR